MKRLLLLCLVLTLASINASRADIPWPATPLPAGGNPAATAAPKLDWLDRVQNTLNQTKGKHFDLLFDGDSITDNWHSRGAEVWAQRYAPLNAFDFGISGDRTEHVLWRLQNGQVDGLDPKLVVIMIGTNNTGRDTAAQIAEGIKGIVAEYEKRCAHAHILLLGVFPRSALPTDPVRAKIKDINKQIASLDDGQRVTFLDFGDKFLQPDGTLSKDMMPDFLHPLPQGYTIWGRCHSTDRRQILPEAGGGHGSVSDKMIDKIGRFCKYKVLTF